MVFSRACLLTSASTTSTRGERQSVRANIMSLARSSSPPAGFQVHRAQLPVFARVGEAVLEAARSCSSSETENQYFRSLMSERISISSKSGSLAGTPGTPPPCRSPSRARH